MRISDWSSDVCSSDLHDFGAEQLPRSAKDKSKAPDTIQAHIKGNFAGWEPKTRFALDNGQIWQVVDDHSAYYRPAMNSQVTLEKGMFVAYYLQIHGLNARVKVTRIPQRPRTQA